MSVRAGPNRRDGANDGGTRPVAKRRYPPPHATVVDSEALQAAAAKLPVAEARDALIRMIRQNPCCVIVGETGSGKTTQIPQYVWDLYINTHSWPHNKGIVGCTQPRRVAAVSVAKHVANQRACEIGTGEVGYAVRFDDTCTDNTRIKFMTDGILLRELQADPMLAKYSVLLLDEAHERTLHGDVLFGLLKDLTRRRPNDLRIVIMSATLNAKQFSEFWRDAPIGVVHGRTFPVQVYHTVEPQNDYVEAAISTILQVHMREPPGDILCFLTGQDEIEDTKRVLEQRLKQLPQDVGDYVVLPLYSAMPYEQQLLVFDRAPEGVRKVIIATNIAETSITVEGIKYVVDAGVVKSKSFNFTTGLESLSEIDISRAQATQRAGRAGRMSEGKCFRLYTEDAFEHLAENTTPEIMRSSLNSIVLQMKALGIEDVVNFEFMDKPSVESIRKAHEVLFLLGAVDQQLKITSLGLRLTDFPLEPTTGKVLLAGKAMNESRDVLAATALISTENLFLTSLQHKDNADRCRSIFARSVGDHATLINLFSTYIKTPKNQRREWCESNSLSYRQMLKVEDTLVQLRDILDGRDHHDPNVAKKFHADELAKWFPSLCSGGGSSLSSSSAPSSLEGRKRSRDDGDDRRSSSLSIADELGMDPPAAQKPGASLQRRDYEGIRRALCFGFFLNAAYFDSRLGNYRTVLSQQVVHLHPTSVIFSHVKKKPALVVFHSVVQTTKKFMKDVSAIQEEWLKDAAPNFFKAA